MPAAPTVLSRHRLPRFYRVSLAALWLLPICLLTAAVLLGKGWSVTLLDPRFWLPLLMMAAPAWYVWRQGLDVLSSGLIRRFHWPRYFAYDQLDRWYFDDRPGYRILTIWDSCQRKVVECPGSHLTHLPQLLSALRTSLKTPPR